MLTNYERGSTHAAQKQQQVTEVFIFKYTGDPHVSSTMRPIVFNPKQPDPHMRQSAHLSYATRGESLVINAVKEILHRLPKGLLNLNLARLPAVDGCPVMQLC